MFASELFEDSVSEKTAAQPIRSAVTVRTINLDSIGRVPTASLIEQAVNAVLDLIKAGHPLLAAASFGKDSCVGVILLLEAVRRAKDLGFRQATHHVTSANTLLENPRIEAHVIDCQSAIERFVRTHDLPVQVHTVEPNLVSTFVVSTIGRGTLPRYPENGQKRACSDSWKVQPQQALAKKLSEEAQAEGFRELVTCIGTRFSESTVRQARMEQRSESSRTPVRNDSGLLVLSAIADWSLSDVWDTLALFLEPDCAPFPTFGDGSDIHRIFELYRESNDGECGINLGDGGHKMPCGARHGCWTCVVGAKKDKSMESMLSLPDNAFMRGLNDFRNWLVAVQHDYSKRELIGRTLSDLGYLPVRPDVFSLAFRLDMLRVLITLDVLEEERAEETAAAINRGDIPRTPHNLRMCEPQFQVVSIKQLVAVDFFLGMHPYAAEAFPALSVWFEVRHLGRRYPVPKVAYTEKTPVPEKRWFASGAFDKDAPTDGLRDYGAEQWGPYLHPERLVHQRVVDGKPMTWFEEAEKFEVDAEKALDLVEGFYAENAIAIRQQYAPIEGSRFLLTQEIVKLPKGMAARYQLMARRGQYFERVAMRLNLTPVEFDAYLLANSISEAEHNALLAEAQVAAEEAAATGAGSQVDMFA